MKDIAILTERRYLSPKLKNWYIDNILLEDRLVLSELKKLGVSCTRVAWDDHFDFSNFRFAVFRTTWNYFDELASFLDFLKLGKKKIRFINPYDQIIWSLNKRYLLELKSLGINIPPTIIVKRGDSARTLSKICHQKSWNHVVIKPCVSAAAWNTYEIKDPKSKESNDLFDRLSCGQDMIIQVFQDSVVTVCEVSLMIIDGKYSHAVLKRVKRGDFMVQDDFGGSVVLYQPTQKEISFANNVITTLPFKPLYGRVDIVLDNTGHIALSELELIEPEMWFRLNHNSSIKMARAIKNYIEH